MIENQIIVGHTKDVLKTFPDESVDCCITSPPYWGLRDYNIEPIIWDGINGCQHEWGEKVIKKGITGGKNNPFADKLKIKGIENYQETPDSQSNFCLYCGAWRGSLGLEPTPELYIKHLLEIFDEIKRVLKRTGTCWVNLGDSYSGSNCGSNDYRESGSSISANPNKYVGQKPAKTNIPAKSLVGIPEMFVLGMRDRGWIRRNTIVWYKPNCMPSSAKDRFTVDWEPVYFFTKSNDTQYWTNERTLELVSKQPAGIHGIEGQDWEWREVNGNKKKASFWSGHDYWFEQQFEQYIEPLNRWGGDSLKKDTSKTKEYKDMLKIGHSSAFRIGREMRPNTQGRNMRCVWKIPTQPYPESHFAVFPEALVEPMIRSGCPEFLCKKCGMSREKIFNTKNIGKIISVENKARDKRGTGVSDKTTLGDKFKQEFIGYATCNCNAGFEPGIVLDPFCGSGTTLRVAERLRRRWIGIDLNPSYKKMADERTTNVQRVLL